MFLAEFNTSIKRPYDTNPSDLHEQPQTANKSARIDGPLLPWELIDLIFFTYIPKWHHAVFREVSKRFISQVPKEYRVTPLTVRMAAAIGSVPLLQWVADKAKSKKGANWRPGFDYTLFSTAAEKGHREIIVWAIREECPGSEVVCAAAAQNNQFALLQWARGQRLPWKNTLNEIARSGNIATMEWALANGCPWEPENLCLHAVLGDSLSMLQWLRLKNCPWNPMIATACAGKGNVEMLKWVLENGCPLPQEGVWNLASATIRTSNYHKAIALLQYLRTIGLSWDQKICEEALCSEKFQLLEWAMANSVPHDFDSSTKLFAFGVGFIDSMIFFNQAKNQGNDFSQSKVCMWILNRLKSKPDDQKFVRAAADFEEELRIALEI